MILLDAQTGQEVRRLDSLGAPVLAVAFSPDGKRLAAGTSAGIALRVWETATGQEVCTVRAASPGQLAWSPDGRLLATGSDQCVNLWDSSTGNKVAALEERLGAAAVVAFSPDGQRLAAADNSLIRVWELGNRRELYVFQAGAGAWPTAPTGSSWLLSSRGR